MVKENNSTPLFRQVNVFNLIISEEAELIHNLLNKHHNDNKQYETPNMFQGIEILKGVSHNRRILKNEMNIPFITVEDNIRMVKMYTLNNDVNMIKSIFKRFLITTQGAENIKRNKLEEFENNAIKKCN